MKEVNKAHSYNITYHFQVKEVDRIKKMREDFKEKNESKNRIRSI